MRSELVLVAASTVVVEAVVVLVAVIGAYFYTCGVDDIFSLLLLAVITFLVIKFTSNWDIFGD